MAVNQGYPAIARSTAGHDQVTREIAYFGEIAETEIGDVATQCAFWLKSLAGKIGRLHRRASDVAARSR
jgi:hypothetical protein